MKWCIRKRSGGSWQQLLLTSSQLLYWECHAHTCPWTSACPCLSLCLCHPWRMGSRASRKDGSKASQEQKIAEPCVQHGDIKRPVFMLFSSQTLEQRGITNLYFQNENYVFWKFYRYIFLHLYLKNNRFLETPILPRFLVFLHLFASHWSALSFHLEKVTIHLSRTYNCIQLSL